MSHTPIFAYSVQLRRQSSDAAARPQLDLASLEHTAALDLTNWQHLHSLPEAFGASCAHLTSLILSGEASAHSQTRSRATQPTM